MKVKRHIKTAEVVSMTGCAYDEVLNLIKTGALQGHKNCRGHWRLNVDSVERHFGIKINSDAENNDAGINGTRIVINENHYQEVIQRIRKAKFSIKIMTGDFKRFNLKPTAKQGKNYKDGSPFVKYLMEKAVQRVSIQVICSEPSKPFMDDKDEYYEQLNQPELFEFKHCIRNHAKAIIIDDKLAYIGSANITPAGLGQGIFTPGNFEVGILTDDSAIVSSIMDFFSKIWAGCYCERCHRAEKCLEI
jgi:phosphatidylserine/phosphatidylglycerophosphate/cardiolipin synthase-like enzyme